MRCKACNKILNYEDYKIDQLGELCSLCMSSVAPLIKDEFELNNDEDFLDNDVNN